MNSNNIKNLTPNIHDMTDKEFKKIYKSLQKESNEYTNKNTRMSLKIFKLTGNKTQRPKGTQKADNELNRYKTQLELIDFKRNEIERKKISLQIETDTFNNLILEENNNDNDNNNNNNNNNNIDNTNKIKNNTDSDSDSDSDSNSNIKRKPLLCSEKNMIINNNRLFLMEQQEEKDKQYEIEYDMYQVEILGYHRDNKSYKSY